MVVAFTICFPWFEMHDIICQFSYFTANQWSEKRELQPETSYLLPGNANAAEVWWSYWRNIQNCMCLKYRITCLLKRLFNGKVTCFMWASRKKYFFFWSLKKDLSLVVCPASLFQVYKCKALCFLSTREKK